MATRQDDRYACDREDADPLHEQHHQRQLETDAEAQRQHQHEAHPLVDPRLGIDAQQRVETEQERQAPARRRRRRPVAAPARNSADAEGQEDVHVALLVRIQPGGHERPDLVEDPRAGQDRAHEQRGLHVDHEGLLGVETLQLRPRIVGDGAEEDDRLQVRTC